MMNALLHPGASRQTSVSTTYATYVFASEDAA